MNYRQQREKQEENLFHLAAKAKENRGRRRAETPCEFRTDFQRDRDRIIYTKALIYRALRRAWRARHFVRDRLGV